MRGDYDIRLMALRVVQIPTSCPREPAHRELCELRVQERLGRVAGIREVKLRCEDGDSQAVLELNYDPRLITLSALEREVKDAGMLLSPYRAELVLPVAGMVSPRSEGAIEAMLSKLPGVVASASFASRSVRVEFDRRQCALPEIVRRLDQLGLRIVERRAPAVAPLPAVGFIKRSASRIGGWAIEHRRLVMAIGGGVFLLAAFLVHVRNGPRPLRLGLVIASYLLVGWITFQDTLRVVRELRFDIDLLMFAAAFGAAALGHYEEGALLLFLFALGRAGEEMAMDRARRAIAALAKLAPETATVREADGHERLVRVEDLGIGQQVVVRPFDRMPADGVVASGASAVDQSPITGESVPVEKAAGLPVFAGTINGEGLLIVSVTKLAGESTLARIVQMVQEAQTTKSPTQVFTDRVQKWYVPAVLMGTGALIALPPLLGGGLWATWFYRAMAFLTGASPCALAIGTPAAVLSGIARAARGGVLIKGGVHLENLGRVSALAFDKTGTLTRGRPELTDALPMPGIEASEMLSLAAAVERGSTHPLAQAIVSEAQARKCPEIAADGHEQITGKGMTARVGASRIAVGKIDLLPADCPDLSEVRERIGRLAAEGKTTVVVARDGRALGVIALADRPRDNAADCIRRLKRMGIARTIMLTGDNEQTAAAVARQVGIDEHFANLLPEDKVAMIRELHVKYGGVAMIGDGVNDAPAMANATVGIAMGGAGTDVALETADVALMADDLAKLPDAIGISRFSRRIIMQNLVIALGVIAILAPVAAMGGAQLGVAVLFHEGSTVVVVLNSLRLLVYRTHE
jgi:Cd2+/Zn2+-exporting ATPase